MEIGLRDPAPWDVAGVGRNAWWATRNGNFWMGTKSVGSSARRFSFGWSYLGHVAGDGAWLPLGGGKPWVWLKTRKRRG